MKRLIAIPLVALAVVALLSAAGGGDGAYRVDAIFDRTAALIPGQEVRFAGAKVGSVADIELTPERRARIQMEVAEGFAPFHRDAECMIRQDALLGEKFVECDPGSPEAPELKAAGGEAPTVPLERNATPVEIDTVLSTFRLPYRQRLRILLNEFGYGLAGRGEDLNELIRRANPALKEAHELLRTLARDRERLARLVEGTDAAVAELASRRREVQGLIERASEVTEATASRRGDLAESIRRLPPLLDELEPSAERLGSFARQATPAMRQLRAAAPSLYELLGDFDPLSDAAVPALERLATTSRIGRRTVRSARPVARLLRRATRLMPAPVRTGNEVLESLRDKGGVEGLLRFVYYATAASARFDAVSHILPSFQVFNQCSPYATTTVAGCSTRFAGATGAGAGAEPATRARARRPAPRGPRAPGPAAQQPATTAPTTPDRGGDGELRPRRPGLQLPDLPELPGLPGERPTGLPLLDWLLAP